MTQVARRRGMSRPGVWAAGWHREARKLHSPNFGQRPPGVVVNLAVVHSISLPPGVYGGDAIERLFTNRLDAAAHPSFALLEGLRVSAHFLIRRDAELLQFVALHDRAWHAGVSCWRGVPNCNDYSIGIELEGLEGRAFEPQQYRALARLLHDLVRVLPLEDVAGHEHVAPGRKGDPGSAFDWARLDGMLRGIARVPPEYFCVPGRRSP